MYLVILSLMGICCGQNIPLMDFDKQIILLEKEILKNIEQPIIQLVNSIQNDMWSKANQRAIKELQRYIKTQDWQRLLNQSIATFLQNHVQERFDEHQESVASLNGTMKECSEKNSQLESQIRALEGEVNETKLENEELNSNFQNLTTILTEMTRMADSKLLQQNNATKVLQDQIKKMELANNNVLNTLVDNITLLNDKLDMKEEQEEQEKAFLGNVTGVDCHDIYRKGARKNGIYKILPVDWTSPPFDVFCDMLDGGWTLLQRRIDGSVNFTRTFNEYVNGFGDLNHEFWLGLEKIHHLTKSTRRVKFDFELRNGNLLNLEYGIFQVRNSVTQYTLRVEQHISGLKANSFKYNNGKKFVTYDRDNRYTCAKRRYGGWWYWNCTYLNINGKYSLQNNESGMTEHCCGSTYNNFRKTIMKIT